MKRIKKFLIAFCCLGIGFMNASFKTVDASWNESYKHKNTIIYTRTTESGIEEFKAITTLNVKMETILGVMVDYKAHPNWMRAIIDCEKIEQVSSKTRSLYYTIDMPWPLWDRDLVSKSTFYPKSNGSVLMKMEAQSTKKEESGNYVRMKSAKGYWLIKPITKSPPAVKPALLINS